MKNGKRGEIWLAKDENGKSRPYVIISSDTEETVAELDHTLLRITSQQPRNKYDVIIEEWEEAGLLKQSVVRCSKIRTINAKNLYFPVGRMTVTDFENVVEALKSYLKI